MNREFRCIACGLLFWERADGIHWTWTCPHCHEANTNEQCPVWACDSTGFAYFVEAHKEYFDELPRWTSLKYTPAEYIDMYKLIGYEIREVKRDDGEGVPLSPAADSAQSMLSDGDK